MQDMRAFEMDANPANWSAEDVGKLVREIAADRQCPPEKRPLYRTTAPAAEYPSNALGPLNEAAAAICHSTQAPFALAAQSVLAAATLAVQAQRDVELPGAGRRPLTEFFVSVAESGERKSTVDRLALSAVFQIEAEWRQEAERENHSYQCKKTAWDAAREHAKRKLKGDMAGISSALDALGPEPKAPLHPMLLVSDPTPEALTLHLARSRPMAGIFTAEGGLLIGGAAFTDDSRMKTAALLNVLWDGDAVRRQRVGTGNSFFAGRRCSAHIMVQPVVAETVLSDNLLNGIGFIARMLIAAPPSTAGTRLHREAPIGTSMQIENYNQRLRFLLLRGTASGNSTEGVNPPVMRLESGARTAWITFHDACERALAANGPLAEIRAFAAKLPEHAGRIAAVLAMYADPETMVVPPWAMECSIALATYYANELLRLRSGAAVGMELQQAQRLLVWWQNLPSPELHLTTVYQNGPASLRHSKDARRAIATLEEHGWAERLPPGSVVEGTPRKYAWRLVP